MNKTKKLYENPDRIMSMKSDSGMRLDWGDRDAVVFGYYDNKMVMSVPDEIRNDWGHIANHTKLLAYNTTGDDLRGPDIHWFPDRGDFEFPGRLWYKHKLMSFWRYPSPSKLLKIIADLNKLAKGKFRIDSNWYIEVILDDKGLAKYARDTAGGRLYGAEKGDFDNEDSITWVEGNVRIIQISKYTGSLDTTKADQAKHHIASPLVKKQKDVPPGIGSKKKLPGQKAKELPAQWRAKNRQEQKLKLKSVL